MALLNWRLRLNDMSNKQHKHAELIKAWADGAEIECRHKREGCENEWYDWYLVADPRWYTNSDMEYRIKPKEKQKVKMWQWIIKARGQKRPTLTSGFYRSVSSVIEYSAGNRGDNIQRADWTEIEIEVDDE